MIQFLRQCEPPTSAASNIFGTQSALPVQLILGGYSYGSWICSHVSDHTLVRKLFEVAPEGSAAAEIMARAQHLAAQTNQEILAAWRETSPRHSSHTHTIGGEETSPERRQRGGEDSPKRFSSDIRKSIDFAKRLGSVRKHYETPGATPEAQDSRTPEHARVGPNVVSDHRVEIAYLLVSPLLPPISAFTTLPFGLNALRAHSEETLQKFSANSSLAIFGSDDMFTSGRKLRSWAQAIGNRPSSQFRFVEVEGAGHFWRSHLVQKSLKIAIREWIQSLEGTPGVIGPESDNVDGS
jgi:alpha/beta superfamily hydrolase